MSAAGDPGRRAVDAISARLVVPSHEAPEVAVVVPTIRDAARLGRCLAAAIDAVAADGIAAELVVVLDGAEPEVSTFVAANVEGATVLSWPERRGLAAGLNAAARATTSARFAVLQDDAVPRPGWLRPLLATAARYPRAGAVGSLVLAPDGRLWSAGNVLWGDGRILHATECPPPAREIGAEVRAVDLLSSSSLLVSRRAWEAVGGFDEELYPAMYVDADFSTALWQAGWLVLLDPHSVVVHEGHGSTERPFRDFLLVRNRARFLDKWGAFVAGRPSGTVTRRRVEEALARAARWLTDPPPANPPAERGPPGEDPPIVHVRRERDLLRAYTEHLEARLAADRKIASRLVRAARFRAAQRIRRLVRRRA